MTEILENRDEWLETYRANWLKHYEETGETLWKIYKPPKNETPVSGKGVDLSKSRLMLVTSAGGYLAGKQAPYDAENQLGDYTIRLFPISTPLDALAYAHDHYDHAAVEDDPQVIIPLNHLHQMVKEGVIGELAPMVVSYMGYQPDAIRTVDETIPAILEIAKLEAIDAALLVPS
jgi:D-proline reductase (dithiol) PrdB